jgi:hypothetical protein
MEGNDEKKSRLTPDVTEQKPIYNNMLVEIASEDYKSLNGVKATGITKFDTFVCGEVKRVGEKVENFGIGEYVWFVRFDAIEVSTGLFLIEDGKIKSRA